MGSLHFSNFLFGSHVYKEFPAAGKLPTGKEITRKHGKIKQEIGKTMLKSLDSRLRSFYFFIL